MKKSLTILMIVICLLLQGCSQPKTITASFDSYMIDDEIAEFLLSSDALFTYEINKTDTDTTQTIYIWNNLLRRQLRLDLLQIHNSVPDEEKIITVENDMVLKIDNREIDFVSTSDLSRVVINAILPNISNVQAKSFGQELRDMIIRLETLERLGDTEVIALETTSSEGVVLENREIGTVQLINDLSDVPELQLNP